MSDLNVSAMNFLQDINLDEDIIMTQSIGEAPKTKCDSIINGLAKDKGTEAGIILVAVAYLLQQGGTSKKVNGDQSITIKQIKVTMSEMQRKCNEVKISPRQFARGIKNDIADIMIKIGTRFPAGNQAKAIKMDIMDLSDEEVQWASDFHTYNDRCPERVRNWLSNNYKTRFRT